VVLVEKCVVLNEERVEWRCVYLKRCVCARLVYLVAGSINGFGSNGQLPGIVELAVFTIVRTVDPRSDFEGGGVMTVSTLVIILLRLPIAAVVNKAEW